MKNISSYKLPNGDVMLSMILDKSQLDFLTSLFNTAAVANISVDGHSMLSPCVAVSNSLNKVGGNNNQIELIMNGLASNPFIQSKVLATRAQK